MQRVFSKRSLCRTLVFSAYSVRKLAPSVFQSCWRSRNLSPALSACRFVQRLVARAELHSFSCESRHRYASLRSSMYRCWRWQVRRTEELDQAQLAKDCSGVQSMRELPERHRTVPMNLCRPPGCTKRYTRVSRSVRCSEPHARSQPYLLVSRTLSAWPRPCNLWLTAADGARRGPGCEFLSERLHVHAGHVDLLRTHRSLPSRARLLHDRPQRAPGRA